MNEQEKEEITEELQVQVSSEWRTLAIMLMVASFTVLLFTVYYSGKEAGFDRALEIMSPGESRCFDSRPYYPTPAVPESGLFSPELGETMPPLNDVPGGILDSPPAWEEEEEKDPGQEWLDKEVEEGQLKV